MTPKQTQPLIKKICAGERDNKQKRRLVVALGPGPLIEYYKACIATCAATRVQAEKSSNVIHNSAHIHCSVRSCNTSECIPKYAGHALLCDCDTRLSRKMFSPKLPRNKNLRPLRRAAVQNAPCVGTAPNTPAWVKCKQLKLEHGKGVANKRRLKSMGRDHGRQRHEGGST